MRHLKAVPSLSPHGSPTREDFPHADSVYRVHGPVAQANATDLYSKDWFIFDRSLVLPEYIIYFNYQSPVRI